FFSSRRRHTRLQGDWSSDVCSSDLLDVAAVSRGYRNALADFDGFDGLDAHERLGQAAIKFFVPLSVAAETGRNIVSDNLEDAADGVVGLENGVHFGFHFVLGGGIRAAQ